MSVLKFFYFSLMILLIGSILLYLNLARASEDIANSAIETAETTMISAFEAVTEAEQAGGNVTGLLDQLNEAGELLAAARMLYTNGDFDDAIYFANLSKNIGEEVEIAAYELKDLASDEGVQRVWFTMLGSISEIILVFSGSLWVWWFLKRRYQ